MKRKEWTLTIEYEGEELALVADNPNGEDLEVWLYRGNLCTSDFILVPNVLPHLYRKFQDEFREKWSSEEAS